MHAIDRAIKQARRRLMFSRWLTQSGWALLVAFVVAAAGVMLDRLGLVVLPVWVYPAVAGVAIVIASGGSLRDRPTNETVAALVDDRMKLKDRLGTALWVEEQADDPFARFVLDEAERTAAAINTHAAFSVQTGRGWAWAMPAWAVLALMVTFLPVFDLFGQQSQRELQAATDQQQAAAAEQILEARSLIEEADVPKSEMSEADPDALLKELADLTRRDLSNPDMRRKAMAKLSEVQQQLGDAYEVKEQQARTLQNQMSSVETGQNGPADRFADALRRGDYEQAQKELEALVNKIEQGDASDGEKELLKQQLSNMANQLSQASQNANANQQQTQQNLNQQLQNAGLSQQQTQQIQQGGYNQKQMQKALQQAYQQQGMSQQQAQQKAQQQAQQMAQQNQQSQSQSQSGGQCQGLSQSMSQMAQSLGQQGQGGSQFSPAAYQAQQQLQQMAQMQQQLQQMQQAQGQMSQAMQNMQQGGRPQMTRGTGGRKAGTGIAGNPLGVEKNLSGQYQTQYEGDIKDRQGRVIASWQSYGEVAAGDATVAFDTAVTEAKTDAERAVTDDRVPRKYHRSIKGYFDQLPESPGEIKRAPSAPR